jgi:hypothetical protein
MKPLAAIAGIDDFAAAAQWHDVSAVPSGVPIAKWVDPAAVSELASLVRAAPAPASPSQPETLSVQLSYSGGHWSIAAYDWNGAQIGGVAQTAEVALLRSDEPSVEASSASLLVNMELPVWHACRIRARLVRNDVASSERGDRFAAEFWTSAEEPPDERVVSLTKTVSLRDKAPASMSRDKSSPLALLQTLLVTPGFIDPPDAEHDWTEHTAVIVAEAIQRLSWPSSTGGPVFRTTEECARLPLVMVTLPPRSRDTTMRGTSRRTGSTRITTNSSFPSTGPTKQTRRALHSMIATLSLLADGRAGSGLLDHS